MATDRADNRIVAVGFLTRGDLDVLGRGFSRHFPVKHDDAFDDLLAKLDTVDATPPGRRLSISVTED
ncbi:MAG TPA: hypothetical protein VF592_04135 [Sphingomonas sp.]|jgi:hypothetical protein|uniref:hypothetical protein n=1 Tax=Sphingomonas sp. TaxID=28214 RepID=UPI002ED96E32